MKTLTATLTTAFLVLASGCTGPTYKEELKLLEQSYQQGRQAHEALVSRGMPTGVKDCEELFNATDVSTKSYGETPGFYKQRKAHFLAGCQGLESPSPDASPSPTSTPTSEPITTPTDTPTTTPTATSTETPSPTPSVTPTDTLDPGWPSPSPTR